uniref:Uncharacterized protein n=1 Tax=Rhinolophus ferrumequinum TaxID=59479 RepID=A0A671DLP4_RHIFE
AASLTGLALVVVAAPWHVVSPLPNTVDPPAPPTAPPSTPPAAPSSDSPRRCRTARTACRPRIRLRCTGAPRGRAGTRRCRNTSGSDPPPGAGPGSEADMPGGGKGARETEKGRAWETRGQDREWPGDLGSGPGRWGHIFPGALRPHPAVPSLSPRGDRSLPAPHLPARVPDRPRAPESSRRRVPGPMTRSLRLWGHCVRARPWTLYNRKGGDPDWLL